jgi:ATP-dependent Clp protease ATP-binding subunit ClpA
MRQTISRAVESPLAERLLAQTFVRGDTVRVTPAEERLNFEKV